jgi:hypothetical protein
MDQQELDNLRQWFAAYCGSFASPDSDDQQTLTLKEQHTYRVCDNMTEIAKDLSLSEGRRLLAHAVALLHDVGRFPQFARFHTFRDSTSVNHAALGAKVLIEHNTLARLPKAEQDLIIRAVTLHNVFALPEGLDAGTLLLVKMVRDADKLDIWPVFIDYCARPPAERSATVGLDLPDSPEYSPAVLASVRRKKLVLLSDLRTLNDFKLLQLAWTFDLNFKRSLQLVSERNYIDGIAATLPRTGEIDDAVDFVRAFVRAAVPNR